MEILLSRVRSRLRVIAVGLCVGGVFLLGAARFDVLNVVFAAGRPQPAHTLTAQGTAPDTVVVFGPKQFVTAKNATQLNFVESFAVPTGTTSPTNPTWHPNSTLYTVRLRRVGGSLTTANVTVNGKQIASVTDFASATYIERIVLLNQAANNSNTVSLSLKGAAGAGLIVTVAGTPFSHYAIFGPKTYTKTSATPTRYSETFALPAGATPPYHIAANASASGTKATVTFNGVIVIKDADFTNATLVVREVNPVNGTNSLKVDVRGNTGTNVYVLVTATDKRAPVLTITSPAPNLATSATTIAVTGTSTDRDPTKVTVNGVLATMSGPGNTQFSATVPLNEGANTLAIRAADLAGNHTDSTRTVIRDTGAPTLSLTSPTDNSYSNQASVMVSGTVSDATAVTVQVNGAPFTVGQDGGFSGSYQLSPGPNFVTVTATDAAGNVTSQVRKVTQATELPVITVTAPAAGLAVGSSPVQVSGTVTGTSPIRVLVNGVYMSVNNEAFAGSVPLTEGANQLAFTATDPAGNQAVFQQSVMLDTQAPVLTVDTPTDGSSTTEASLAVSGSVSDATAVRVTVNGAPATIAGSAFAHTIALAEGANSVTVIATDTVGNTVAIARAVTRSSGPTEPPNPGGTLTHESLPIDATIGAPALSSSTATPIGEAVSFLYSGPNPVQTGVIADSISEERVALVRGRVVTSSGAPFPGVRVGVRRHPELGSTLTRADGSYNLVVNGGGPLTLEFVHATTLTAHRQVVPEWQGYATVEEVALLGVDPAVTEVNFANPTAPARGSVVTDEDGRRQATLLFPENTVATMVLPDGSTQPLQNARVRITEYTVGPLGRASMPAPLPPTSAYTYAAEFTIDEAEQAGAATVRFNHPIPVYLENFLNSPVGAIVPVGYYDRQREVWVPAPNGRVLRVVSIIDNRAQLDVTGAGTVSPEAVVRSLGISDAEQAQLAGLYQAGATLWRAALDHFSLVDLNHAKEQKLPEEQKKPPKLSKCAHLKKGSIIECENQTLGERLPIAGTSYTLNYRTSRSTGFTWSRTIEIPVTGDEENSDLLGTKVIVRIAGREFTQQFDAAPNRSVTFVWDGRDAYGRQVVGTQEAEISVGYLLRAPYVFLLPSGTGASAEARAFGLTCTQAATSAGQEECVVPDSLVPNRGASYAFTKSTEIVGNWDARSQGLGGWTLSAVHAYVPATRMLELGDGTFAAANEVARRVENAAGTGARGYSGDGGPANAAVLGGSGRIAVGPDGILYIADADNHRVRRVRRDGMIETIAGVGSAGFSGDGGAATAAELNSPSDIAVGPDGLIYILDAGNGRVRRIDRNGLIATVPGSQLPGISDNMEIAQDGAIYITTHEGRHLQRLAPDGSSSIILGDGTSPVDHIENPEPFRMDSVAATRTPAGITGFAIGADGTIYEAEGPSSCIRRIATDGMIYVIGNPCQPAVQVASRQQEELIRPASYTADGAYVRVQSSSRIGATDIAVSPDGAVYIADFDGSRIWRQLSGGGPEIFVGAVSGADETGAPLTTSVSPVFLALGPTGELYFRSGAVVQVLNAPLRAVGASGRGIMSPDGSELFVFDDSGRHTRTFDASTGMISAELGYDGNGGVISIMDRDSTITRIERDGSGMPTAVIAPFGQRTTLVVGADGYLSSATQAGRSVSMQYSPGGLLTQLRDAGGADHTFAYDSVGLLLRDTGPDGMEQRLARIKGDSASAVVRHTTRLGRTTQYLIGSPSDSIVMRTTIDPAGVATTTQSQSDGQLTVMRASDGTTVSTLLGIDALTGQSRPVSMLAVETPSGLRRVTHTGQTVELAIPGDPLSLVSRTDSTRVGHRTWVNEYNAVTRTLRSISPSGRNVTAVFDARGRITEVRMPALATVYRTYDQLGRLAMQRRGQDTTKYQYDGAGLLSQVAGPLGMRIDFTYDSAGQLRSKQLPGGREILYSYDAAGRRTSITTPGGQQHSSTFSVGGRRESIILPAVGTESGTTRYDYDADGESAGYTLPDGAHVQFRTDSAGRPIAVVLAEGEAGTRYGPATGLTEAIWTAGGKDSLVFQYDGALITGMRAAGQVAGTVAVGYDDAFRVQSIGVGDEGLAASFSYDDDDLLIAAGDLSLERREDTGLLRGATLGSIQTAWAHDSLAHLRTFATLNGADSLLVADYTYDALGRVTTRRERAEGTAHTYGFTYAAAGWLETETVDGAVRAAYDYDPNGNRIRVTTPAGVRLATFDARDRMRSSGDATFEYSPNGSLVRRIVGTDTTRYAYDGLGNLLSVSLPSGTTVDYFIDAQGRRIGKRVNGTVVQRLLYQTQLAPVAEVDAQGAITTQFVYATHSNVPDYMVRGDSTYRLVLDHLGSVRMVVNAASGSVAQRIDYDAFGRVTLNTQPGFQPFGYAGGIQDEDTHLVHFGAREYDPEGGRWTSTDAAGVATSLNLYMYANNEPIGWRDASGFEPQQQRQERPDLGPQGNLARSFLDSDFERDMFERYWFSKGNLHLSAARFKSIASKAVKINDPKSPPQCIQISGVWYYKRQVNLYGAPEYNLAFGTATIYYDEYDEEALRLYDRYNFDEKDWGERPILKEVMTRATNSAGERHGATPFSIFFP